MSFEAERAALETRFQDNWVETPIRWGNTSFNPMGLDEYVWLTLVNNDSDQVQVGNIQHLYRHYSLISNQIFVKSNIGSRRAYELADMVADLWRTFSYNYITIQTPELVELGIVDGWFQLTLIHPYYRNEYAASA